MVSDPSTAGLVIAVYDRFYVRQGWLNDYELASVTWQHLDVGPGAIVIPEVHPMATFILEALEQEQVVPVVVTWNGQRWSGRVANASLDEGDGSTPAAPGAGIVTITLVDEWQWLRVLAASPNGANSSLTGMPQSDTRTGPLETLTKGYLSDALTRLGITRVAVVPPPVVDTSVTVTFSARWTKLEDLFAESLRNNNFTCSFVVWLPGDDQPPGLSLSEPTVVFDLHAGVDDPRLVWTDETVLSRKIAVTTPAAYRATLAGLGTGADQLFYSYTAADLQAAQGPFGFPEAYFSLTQNGAANPTTDARIQLAATRGGLAVQATVEDGVPWVAFQDYVVGDIGGVEVLGTVLRQRVTSIEVTDDRKGLRVIPTIGDDIATLTPQQKLTRTVSALKTRVNQLPTGI
jgi:hypothetical protein